MVKDFGKQVRDESVQKITAICVKLKDSLSKRRRTKIYKLCISNHSDNEEEIEADSLVTERGVPERPSAPSSLQIHQFITDIRIEVDNQITPVLVEDVGLKKTFMA